jgi:hypothetical protein
VSQPDKHAFFNGIIAGNCIVVVEEDRWLVYPSRYDAQIIAVNNSMVDTTRMSQRVATTPLEG